MKQVMIISLLFCCSLTVFAQLTIHDCYIKARDNYPLIKQYGLIEKSKDYHLSNASKGYLPQITFSAKISYQSEVTEVPIVLPGIKGMNKDQYGATVDVSQVLWDGGMIQSKKEMIRTGSEVEKKSLEVDLYAIKDRINQLYFGILLFDAQLEQNRLFQEELKRNLDKVSACIKNGVANQADLDAVKVEQLKAIQVKSQLTHVRNAYVDVLSAMIHEKLDEQVVLLQPEQIIFSGSIVQRPELELFKAQVNRLEVQQQEIRAGWMPKLGIFLTGGYGNPGLNMLKSGFSSYYIVGMRLSWNLSNLYPNKNNKRLIQNNIQSVLTQQENFLFHVNLDVLKKQRELSKYREQIKYDDEIISLRNSVKQSSEAKMSNGTLSGIDWMRDVLAEDLAKQEKILHEIELLLTMYHLKYIRN